MSKLMCYCSLADFKLDILSYAVGILILIRTRHKELEGLY